MQTFTGQLYVNKKMFALDSKIWFHALQGWNDLRVLEEMPINPISQSALRVTTKIFHKI